MTEKIMVKKLSEKPGSEIVEPSLAGAVQHLLRQDLLTLICQVEDAVHRGTAQMRDYETFVLCKQELARREFLYKWQANRKLSI